uniref:SGNH hydrolase-type esterase domain-containing protein n=1 Tax=Stegastes partitus TaxID=144197 RepID=A0A3B5BJR4_9TELE
MICKGWIFNISVLCVFVPGRGTGYRHAVRRWPTSLVTGRSHKLVIPAEAPEKKFVLLVGDSHLRSIADGIVAMPEGKLSFGVMSTPGAAAAELQAEFKKAVLPRKPHAVLVQAPSNNLTASRTIHEAAADFGKFLATVCSQHANVVVTDFPPRLNVNLNLQQHLRQEYCRVAASVKYYPVTEYFPMNNLELWCRDGVHLSDTVGMPVLAQLMWKASYMVLELPAPPKLQSPPRQAQCPPSQRIVVTREVIKRVPPANPFEWSTVRRGQKVR